MKIPFEKLKQLLTESLSSNAYEDILCDVFEVDDISEITEEAYKQLIESYLNNKMNEHDSTMLEKAEDIVLRTAIKNGYNLVAHHGTINKFSEFKNGDIGFHLGTLEQATIAAKQHKHPHLIQDTIFLNTAISIHSPLVIEDDLGSWQPDEIVNGAVEYFWYRTKIKTKLFNKFNKHFNVYDYQVNEILDNKEVVDFIETEIKNARIRRKPGDDNSLAQFCFLYYDLKFSVKEILQVWVVEDYEKIKKILLNRIKFLGYDGIKYLNLYEVEDEALTKHDYSYIVFDANQIKNCEVISFKDGKVVPLEERFNSSTNNLFESSSSIDDEYEDILCEVFEVDDISEIKKSDYNKMIEKYMYKELNEHDSSLLEDAEKLVIKTAIQNGYNLVAHHGTENRFSEFKHGDIGFHFGTLNQAEFRLIYNSDNPDNGIILNTAISLHNPLVIEDDLGSWTPYTIIYNIVEFVLSKFITKAKDHFGYTITPKTLLKNDEVYNFVEKEIENANLHYGTNTEEIDNEEAASFMFMHHDLKFSLKEIIKLHYTSNDNIKKKAIVNRMKSLGYDGIKYLNKYELLSNEEIGNYSYIVLNANQIKNCEVVSFKDGKVVPLENRFNSNTNNLFETDGQE